MEKAVTLDKRDSHLDLIRIIAMLFVISIHTLRDYETAPFLRNLMTTLFFTANGMFFFMSGRFALRFKENPDDPASSYRSFYWKKFCALVLPLVFYFSALIANYYHVSREREFRNIKELIMDIFWCSFPASTAGYKWFIYCLIGFMMTAPFMASMFRGLSDTGLKIFFWTAVGFEAVSIVFFDYFLKAGFPVYGWPFLGWYFYFLCGYIIYRLDFFHKKKWLFIIIGAVGLFYTAAMITVTPEGVNGALDDSPVYLFTCIGVYLLFESIPVIKPLKKVTAFLADHTFAVYLIHYDMILFIRQRFSADNPLTWFRCVLLVALCSFAFAIPCDLLILNPLKKYLTGKAPSWVRVAFTVVFFTVLVGIPAFLMLKSRIAV